MQRRYQAMLVATLAASCAVLAVVLVSEGHEGDTDIVKEEQSVQWLQNMQTNMLAVQKAGNAATIDDSQQKTKAALTKSAEKMHEGNKAARRALRDKTAQKAQNVVAKAVGELTDSVAKTARNADTKIAAAVAEQEMPKIDISDTVGTEDKVNRLKDYAQRMLDTVAKAREEAKAADDEETSQASRFKRIIQKKVLKTKAVLDKMKSDMKPFEGVTSRESNTRHELHRVSEKVKRLKDQLSSTRDHLQRIEERQEQFVQRRKRKVTKSKKDLNRKLTKYREILQGLKTKLHAVRNATDINQEMAAHIITAKAVVGKQQNKISQLKQDIMRLTNELNRTHTNIAAFAAKAKRRKHALHVAQSTVQYLSDASKNLKSKVTEQQPSVHVTVSRGNSERTAHHIVGKAVQGIIDESKKARKNILHKVVSEAQAVAKKQAEKLADEQAAYNAVHVKVPGANSVLAKAGKIIASLGLGRRQATTHANDGTEPNKEPSSSQPEAVGSEVHQAELMAHVAHTLYQKALKTKSASDKRAAKVAMRKAIALHDSIGVKFPQ